MLLAIDTSTRQVGISLYDGTTIIAEEIWHSHDYHTAELAPAVQHILMRANVQVSELKALGIATGPGSFTGLRIGLALVKGISLACHLPVFGVPSLDIIAYAQPVQDIPLTAVLSAGRQRLAVGWYQAKENVWHPTGTIEVLEAQALAERIQQPTLVSGELSEEDRRVLGRKHRNVRMVSPARSLRRPSYLAEIAWKRWLIGKPDDPATLAPVYLHIGAPIPG
jgi:tRNA threonylcarbamoyladenosine biosynthesis protein TsaB